MKFTSAIGAIFSMAVAANAATFEAYEQTVACKNTNQVVQIAGEAPTPVQYCSKSYDMREVLTKLENIIPANANATTIVKGFNEVRGDGLFDFKFKDDISSHDYFSMACNSTLRVVPVSAWFRTNDNSWKERLDKVLAIASQPDNTHRAGWESCSGNRKACVRTWSEIFPGAVGAQMPQAALDEIAQYKELRVDYLCVPEQIKNADIVTAVAMGQDSSSGQGKKTISFNDMCPGSTKFINPLLVIDGANCGGIASVDITTKAKQACDVNEQISARSPSCTFTVEPTSHGDIPEIRGCPTTRTIAVAACHYEDGSVHASATKKMNNYILKSFPGKLKDQVQALDRHDTARFTLCSFRELQKLHASTILDAELCCLAESIGLVTDACEVKANKDMQLSPQMTAQKTKVLEWLNMQFSSLVDRTCNVEHILSKDKNIPGCSVIIDAGINSDDAERHEGIFERDI